MASSQKPNIDPKLIPVLDQVTDPEIPVLTVLDMGVIREAVEEEGVVKIKLTPTYSGCPAMDVIGDDLKDAFLNEGKKAEVELVLAPAWTTDWLSDRGKQKLETYGIAAPLEETADKEALFGNAKIVQCTNCKSKNTHLVSQFGSTACKALFKCNECLEPFDYFKCLT